MYHNCSCRRSISLGFTEETVREGLHICYIYNDDAERQRIMAKYLESGMLCNEKVMYLVDVMTPEEFVSCLAEMGVDIQTKPASVNISEASSTYCPTGIFNVEDMLCLAREFHIQAVNDGYEGSRATGEMSWCLAEGRVDETSLMEYEAKLNLLVAEHPMTACCQYDARRFDGQVILDVLNVHPVMIVRGQLVKNPYYVEPELFLRELKERQKEPVA